MCQPITYWWPANASAANTRTVSSAARTSVPRLNEMITCVEVLAPRCRGFFHLSTSALASSIVRLSPSSFSTSSHPCRRYSIVVLVALRVLEWRGTLMIAA